MKVLNPSTIPSSPATSKVTCQIVAETINITTDFFMLSSIGDGSVAIFPRPSHRKRDACYQIAESRKIRHTTPCNILFLLDKPIRWNDKIHTRNSKHEEDTGMAYDKILAERVGQLLLRRPGFTEKQMFGGVGFLHNGNMCVGVWKFSLVVRLGKDRHDEAMAHPHAGPFDITGREMKGWALIEPAGIATDATLEEWVGRAAEYVATLPAKMKK